MKRTGNFLGDLLGSNLSVESIEQYANQLKEKNQVPFIHFADEGFEDDLMLFRTAIGTEGEEILIDSFDKAEEYGTYISIGDVYDWDGYELKRGPLFYASNYVINYSFETFVIFTQDGLFMRDFNQPGSFILYPWDLWGEVLYTQHAHLAAPVILLANPTQPGVPEMSISPIFDMKFNGKIYKGVDQNGNEVTGESYDNLTLSTLNFAYQILERFYKEAVDKNRNSNLNSIPLDLFSWLYKKDFKIFDEKEEKEEDAEYWFKNGIEAIEKKRFKEAIVYFNKAIELNPNSKLGFYNRGLAKNALKDHQGAVEDFTKLIELDPDEGEPYFQRGQSKSALKDYKGAIEDYNKAIELNPGNDSLYQNRGKAKSNLEDYQGSIEDYIKAIEINPDWWGYYHDCGNAKNNLKDYQGAIEDYTKVIELNPDYKWTYQNRGKAKSNLEDYQGAIEDFNKVIEIDPDYKWAYEPRGIAKSKLKDYKGAIEDFNNAIEKDAKWNSIYYNRGLAKHNLKDFDSALDDYDYLVSLGSRHIHLWYNIELAKSKLENYRGEIENLTEDARDSNYVKAYFNRAMNVWEPLGLRKEQIEDLNKVLEIDPNFKSAYENRGIAKSKLKDYKGAIEDFNKAIKIDPNNDILYDSRGRAKKGLKDYHGAIEDFSKAIELYPEWTGYYNLRGQIKIVIKDFQGAIEDCNAAIKLNSKEDWLYYYRGLAKRELMKFEDALIDIKKAIELDPNAGEYYYEKGKTKIFLNDYQGAIEDFNKAIELNPDDKLAYEERDKARKLLDEGGDLNGAKKLNPEEKSIPKKYEVLQKKHESLENYKGSRAKRLAHLGVQMAIKALEENGFNKIRDYTVEKSAFPFVNLYAERDGKNYVINVKARNKFQKDLKENLYYNVGKKGHENAQIASDEFNAEAYWMAIPFDKKNYAVYFGSMQELNFKNAIPIKKCKNGEIGAILKPETAHNQDWNLFENEKES